MIAGKNRRYFPFLILAGLLAINQGTFAESWNDNPGSAFQIAKKKGKIVSTEVLDWHASSKDIPKDWVTLKNKYFTVSYPKCFQLEADGGEGDDVKKSPSVLFKRSESCPDYKKNMDESNTLGIGYENGISPQKSLWVSEENALKTQTGKLNGLSVKFIAKVEDYNNGVDTQPILMKELYLLCGTKVMSIISSISRGKITVDTIEQRDFDFPQDFKEIISTFECPNNSDSKSISLKNKKPSSGQ